MSKEQKQSKWQWFFMVIFIPAIFALILAVVVLYYMGINVGERVQEAASILPFVEKTEESLNDEEAEMSTEEKIAQLEHENESYQSQITQLENEISAMEQEIAGYEEEASSDAEEEEKDNNTSSEENEEPNTDVRDAAKTIEGMTASKAADIISEMNHSEAAMYLRLMRVDSRSQILGKMEPAKAAQIIKLLAN